MNNIGSLMSAEKMAEFCKRWKIDELALFGSALNEGFKSDSDVDILVSFAPDADWSLIDHVRIKRELESILHRNVDLVSKHGVERSQNPVRRKVILETAETIFSSKE